MIFEVLILGNSSATPVYKRYPTAQLINHNQQLFLVDCGEGTQHRLVQHGIKTNKIQHIFISHLHGDHYFGLAGLLSSMNLAGRERPLTVYGPKGLKEILDMHFLYAQSTIKYPLRFIETDPEKPALLLDTKEIKVQSFPLKHRIPCTGFRFDEKEKKPNLIKEKIEELQIPVGQLAEIKNGGDYIDTAGRIFTHEELTHPTPKLRSYAFCSDTRADDSYIPFIKNVSLLYHEATFLDELKDRAEITLHTTALEAGEVAAAAQAGKLLIGHYSSRYKEFEPFLEEARSVFANTELTVEGSSYSI